MYRARAGTRGGAQLTDGSSALSERSRRRSSTSRATRGPPSALISSLKHSLASALSSAVSTVLSIARSGRGAAGAPRPGADVGLRRAAARPRARPAPFVRLDAVTARFGAGPSSSRSVGHPSSRSGLSAAAAASAAAAWRVKPLARKSITSSHVSCGGVALSCAEAAPRSAGQMTGQSAGLARAHVGR